MRNGLALCAAAVATAFLVLAPGAAGSRLAGAPPNGISWMLLAASIVVAVAVFLLPPARRTSTWVPILVGALIVLKTLVGSWAPDLGWRGVYFMDATTRVDFKAGLRTRPFRTDRRVMFQRATFGLHFLNDVARYNDNYSWRERQWEFPLRVEWTGYVSLGTTSSVRLQFSGRGLAGVTVDGRDHFEFDLNTRRGPSQSLELSPGVHQLVVSYSKAAQQDASFGFEVLEGERVLTPAPTRQDAARVRGASGWQLASDAAVLMGLALLAAALVRGYWPPASLLARLTGKDGLARASVVAAFAILLLFFVRSNVVPIGVAAVNLYSGDDPLVYESGARDVLFHGLLMPNGAAVGQGRPFYHYPLYSYLLAGAHAVLGEQFAAVVFLNVLSVSALVVLCWYLGWRKLGTVPVVAGVALMAIFVARHLMPYTATAFSDNVFITAAFVSLLFSVFALERGSPGWLVLAGISTACAAAARPSFLTYVGVLSLAILIFGARPWRQRLAAVAIFVAGFGAGVAPFALRNWIMARKLVFLVNSWIQIPYFLYPWDQKNPVQSVSGLSDAVAKAVEIIRAHPGMVADVETRKVAFTLGFTQAGPSNVGAHWDLVVGFLAFLAVFGLRRLPRPLAIVLGAFAASHLAAMVLAAPWTYGYKTILPLHAVFLFTAIYLVSPLPQSGTDPADRHGAEARVVSSSS